MLCITEIVLIVLDGIPSPPKCDALLHNVSSQEQCFVSYIMQWVARMFQEPSQTTSDWVDETWTGHMNHNMLGEATRPSAPSVASNPPKTGLTAIADLLSVPSCHGIAPKFIPGLDLRFTLPFHLGT